MPHHRDLTGDALHEPKGADSASVNTVYIADGSGSGAFALIGPDQIDQAEFLNLNKEQVVVNYLDIGTAGSRWIPFTRKLNLTKAVVALQGTTGGGSTILTFRNHAGASMGTISIPSTGVAGNVFSLTPIASNSFLPDQHLQIETDGGTSGSPSIIITLELQWSV